MKKTSIHPSLERILDTSGLDMAEVAGLLGISTSTVSRWARQGISQAGANKLGKLLNLDPVWIMTGEKAHATSTAKPNAKKPKLAKPSGMIAKEAMLEFAEQENGVFALREIGGGDTWVSIEFAEILQEMLGKETLQIIGQHMIQAGIASFMERQMRQYHAHVYDETPEHFS